MAMLGKDLLDFRRPLTHTKVQFGEKLYWIEENTKGIPYGRLEGLHRNIASLV